MLKFNRRLTKREKLLLVIVFMVITILILWSFYLWPTLSSYREIKEQRKEFLQRVLVAEEYLQREKEIEEEFACQQQIRAEKSALLLPEDLPLVMGELQQLFEEAPVSLETLRVGNVQEYENYRGIPIVLQVGGEPEKVYSLLKKLENSSRLLLIEGVSWQRFEEEIQERQFEISARLVMTE